MSTARDSGGPETGATPGVGEYLAQQRRLRGISVDELCDLTKIPRRNLERLESGAFDEKPDGFARGFVRTVADALGLDPDEAVMRLMREPADEGESGGGHALAALLRWGSLAVAAGLALLLWKLGSVWLSREVPAPELPLLYRQDAVGDLARERPRAEVPEPAERPGREAP